MKKLLLFALVVLGFSAASFGQSTITASSSATLVTPLSISKTEDLNFGTLAATGTAGTVDIDYLNDLTVSDGVEEIGGTPKTAVFTVTGAAGESFSVTIPSPSVELDMTGGGSTGVKVTGFACEEGSSATLSGSTGSGTKTLHVKARLIVPANAVAGTYTNASGLFVTVNYN